MKNKVEKPFDVNAFPQGVNIMGPVKAQMGIGQCCRFLVSEFDASGIKYCVQNFNLLGNVQNGDTSFDDILTEETPYGINLIVMEPTELMFRCTQFDQNMWNDKYNVGFWSWELEDFPKEWTPAIDLLDEIWTPSEFTSDSIRKVTNKPVHTIPYNVTAHTDDKYDRKFFGLPEDKFLFLIMFDFNSTMVRKNPVGAIEAYKKAFDVNDDSVGLVIKTSNTDFDKIESVKKLLEGYKNIYFITEVLEKTAVNSLIKDVDVFVSLHRAEGFGIVMAEAMLVNTVCIATNWSSNIEFMNKDIACMVDYSFVTLEKDASPYRKGSKWADADTDQAAEYMKKLHDDKDFYNTLSTKAKAYIEDKLCMDNITKIINGLVTRIINENSTNKSSDEV